MNIKAEAVKGRDLKAGDLFSTRGSAYWERLRLHIARIMGNEVMEPGAAIGERVYIRTEAPCPKDQEDVEIYRITVEP